MGQPAKELPLSKDERLKFVNAVLEAGKDNPDWGWRKLFEKARKVLKPGRMSNGIDHPNKILWIKPMLGLIESPQNLQTSNGVIKAKLTEEDKKNFAQTVFELQKNNPDNTFNFFIQGANKMLPAEKQLGSELRSFNQIPWIKPLLDKLEAKPKKRPQLSEEERIDFAKAFFEYKKANPEATSLHAIRAVRDAMPEHRKIGAGIDSVKQIPWIIPLLEQLENPPKVPSRFACKLSDKEKAEFAEIVYRLKKGGATWTRSMREANAFMPKEHKISENIVNPSSVPWLSRALVKLEEEDKSKVVIDHRGILPKAEAPAPEYVKERKRSKTKTYWNDDDKHLFAEVTYQLKICNPGWGWQKILDEANKEMPGHKQRPKMPPSPSQIPWLGSMLDRIAKRPAERREPEPVRLPEIATPVAAPAPAMDMQAMMMAAFEKVVREQLAAGGMGALSLPAVMPTNNVQPEKPARKKVIVVGLLAIQTNEIQKRFGHKFDFKFIGSNTPNQQIRESLKNGDIGILMTRFVSHPTQAAMRDHPGFTFCNGNSTALENLLEEKVRDGQ